MNSSATRAVTETANDHANNTPQIGDSGFIAPNMVGIPAVLLGYDQFVGWNAEPGDPKPRKVPKNPRTGFNAKPNEPETWGSASDAASLYQKQGLTGIGFVFTSGDPFMGVDLDHARDPETGEMAPWAAPIVKTLDSYTEVSPSGTGLHVIIRATKGANWGSKVAIPGGHGEIEMYDHGRYFTLTGHVVDGHTLINDRQEAVNGLYSTYFAGGSGQTKPHSQAVPIDGHTQMVGCVEVQAARSSIDGTRPQTQPKLSDGEILNKVHRAANVAKFNTLWNGDTSAYGGDDSRADLALCTILAFYTGNDAVQLDRLFRQSKLMRPKWDEKRGQRTYGQITVEKAIGGCTTVYSPNSPDADTHRELAAALLTLEDADGTDRPRVLKEIAVSLGQFVGAGLLDRGAAEEKLLDAAVGLNVGDDYLDIIQTGMDDGICSIPREEEVTPGEANRATGDGTMGDGTMHVEPTQELTGWDFARMLFPRTEFPMDVLPSPISDSLKQLARSHAGSANPLPGAAFAIIGSAIGRTYSVAAKNSWKEPSIIWYGDIRDSGSGKTSPLWDLAGPLVERQRQERERFKAEQEEYEEKLRASKKGDPKPKPPKTERGYFTTDFTLEGLRPELDEHPTGGLVVILNELSALINGLNQYKKGGNDRESLLNLHDGKPARVCRAGKPAVLILNSRVSITGGIQPKVFNDVFGSNNGIFLEDGTIYRFLFTFEPPAHFAATMESWEPAKRAVWDETVLAALKWTDQQPQDQPIAAILSTAAQSVFFDWRNAIDRQKSRIPRQMHGFLSKAYGYALRLTGVIHAIDAFHRGGTPKAMLDVEDVRRGIAVAEFYLGQAVDAIFSLTNGQTSAPQEVSERTKTLAVTLEGLRDKVDNKRLAIGFIAREFNALAPKEQQIDAKGMGALLRDCGLTIPEGKHHANGHAGVRCMEWNEATEKFLRTLRTSRMSRPRDESLDITRFEDMRTLRMCFPTEGEKKLGGVEEKKEVKITSSTSSRPQNGSGSELECEDVDNLSSSRPQESAQPYPAEFAV